MPRLHQIVFMPKRVPVDPAKGLIHATISSEVLTPTVTTGGTVLRATQRIGELLDVLTPRMKNPIEQRLETLHRVLCALLLQRGLLQARAVAVLQVARVGVLDTGAVGNGANGIGIDPIGTNKFALIISWYILNSSLSWNTCMP